MILRVFIDETSSHGDAAAPLMLSGCVSSMLRWSRFDKKWQSILKKNGLRYIRHHDILHGRGEFEVTPLTRRPINRLREVRAETRVFFSSVVNFGQSQSLTMGRQTERK